ncbi:MAG: BatA domain-containing protein [Planctomycetes bacterium]|nr:BatA domain-containing protein [Planctomycetota bacterium]
MSFLNPALLAGTALFAVPLIIHLLNRQRHKKRPWAAMEFLLRAYQKQRNRLRNENLLLLLLRCLIPVLLALAIARPMLQQAGSLFGGGGTTHHVVVLDCSYSMGEKRDGQSPFEKGRGQIARLLERLEARTEKNDKITLVAAGVRPRFLVRADMNLATARSQWLMLQRPDDAAGNLKEALVQVADAIEETPEADTQVYLLSDLQKQALGSALHDQKQGPTGPEFEDTVRDVVERLGKLPGVGFHLIDVGPYGNQRSGGVVDNVQVTGLRIDQPAAVVRVPVTLTATLRNRGQSPASVQVTLDVDGSEPTRKVVALEPGTEGEAEFQVTFRETGRRRVHVTLGADVLEADDEWFLTIDVRERIRVLLVDGTGGDDPLRTDTWLWQSVLDPTLGQGSPDLTVFEVRSVDTLALLSGQVDPAAHDLVILSQVDRLSDKSAELLQKAVQAGKGLLVAFGDRTDVESYNLHLHQAGDGPQPFRLLRTAGGAASSTVARAPSIALPEHPLLKEFEEEIYREIFQKVPVYRWLSCAMDTDRSAPGAETPPAKDAATAPGTPQVVARLTDPDQSPLLVARQFGEGRVVFLLSAPMSEFRADRWNRFDDRVVAYPLLFGIVKWLALPGQDPFNGTVGSELTCSLPARPENVEVVKPEREGAAKVPLSEDTRPLPGGRYALPPFAPTLFAGFYTFDFVLDRESGKEHLSLPFAVNVEPAEGDLVYAPHDEVRQALAIDRVLTALPTADGATAEQQRTEFGPMLLWATLLFVLAEAAMARYVSVRRS